MLETQNIAENKEMSILIGDRNYDVFGAHCCGIKCAGILWGFGDRDEFEKAGADWIFETPEELEIFLAG